MLSHDPDTTVHSLDHHESQYHQALQKLYTAVPSAANSALFARCVTLMPTQDLIQGATEKRMHVTLLEDTCVKND